MELDCPGGDFALKALFHEFPRIRRDDGGVIGGYRHTGSEFLIDVIVGHDSDVPPDFNASVAAEAIEEAEGASPWNDYDLGSVLQGKHRFNGLLKRFPLPWRVEDPPWIDAESVFRHDAVVVKKPMVFNRRARGLLFDMVKKGDFAVCSSVYYSVYFFVIFPFWPHSCLVAS